MCGVYREPMTAMAKARLLDEAESTGDTTRMSELAEHRDRAVRAAVARNPSAPIALLERLVADKNYLVRFAVARNPSPAAWQIAMTAPDADVRVILAQRQDLDEQTLERLVAAPEVAVRMSVAESTQRSDVLHRLARDPEKRVRAATATRPELLSDDDLELLAADKTTQVRAVVVQSRRLSEKTVTRLAADRSGHVRYFTLEAHPERFDLAERLQADKDSDIADLARRIVAERPTL